MYITMCNVAGMKYHIVTADAYCCTGRLCQQLLLKTFNSLAYAQRKTRLAALKIRRRVNVRN